MSFQMNRFYRPHTVNNDVGLWQHLDRFVITKQEDDLSFESSRVVLERLRNYLVVYFHYVQRATDAAKTKRVSRRSSL